MTENKEKKYCRFVSEQYHDSFQIEDGGTIFVNGNELKVTYVDSYHFMVEYSCFHIQEFYDKLVELGGNIVLPGKGLKTKEYASNYRAYEAGTYETIYLPDLGDEPFEYSNLRIIPETLPLGMYVYDIVSESDCNGGYNEWICKHAWINHLGCVISNTQVFKPSSLDNRIYLENGLSFEERKTISK